MNKKEQIQEEVPYESEQKSVRCPDAVQLANGSIKTSIGFTPSMAEISIMSWKALKAGSLQKFMYFSSSGLSCMTFFFGEVRVPPTNTYDREPCDESVIPDGAAISALEFYLHESSLVKVEVKDHDSEPILGFEGNQLSSSDPLTVAVSPTELIVSARVETDGHGLNQLQFIIVDLN
jgi:hypothetical protein